VLHINYCIESVAYNSGCHIFFILVLYNSIYTAVVNFMHSTVQYWTAPLRKITVFWFAHVNCSYSISVVDMYRLMTLCLVTHILLLKV